MPVPYNGINLPVPLFSISAQFREFREQEMPVSSFTSQHATRNEPHHLLIKTGGGFPGLTFFITRGTNNIQRERDGLSFAGLDGSDDDERIYFHFAQQ